MWVRYCNMVAILSEARSAKSLRTMTTVTPANRSLTNVPFTLTRPDLDRAFLAEAKAAGLVNLEGHRSVGGMRASLYNGMSEAGVDALVEFMKEFENRHG